MQHHRHKKLTFLSSGWDALDMLAYLLVVSSTKRNSTLLALPCLAQSQTSPSTLPRPGKRILVFYVKSQGTGPQSVHFRSSARFECITEVDSDQYTEWLRQLPELYQVAQTRLPKALLVPEIGATSGRENLVLLFVPAGEGVEAVVSGAVEVLQPTWAQRAAVTPIQQTAHHPRHQQHPLFYKNLP